SEIISAFLFAQLEQLEIIQLKRISIWNQYYEGLKILEEKGQLVLPKIPESATNNAHMFYIICKSFEERSQLIQTLKNKDIHPVFHYLSLNKSDYFLKDNIKIDIPNSDHFTDCLLRLPFYFELNLEEQRSILEIILEFFTN